jgi:hypothetical protein
VPFSFKARVFTMADRTIWDDMSQWCSRYSIGVQVQSEPKQYWTFVVYDGGDPNAYNVFKDKVTKRHAEMVH